MELVVDSVIEGNWFGRIWVDDAVRPKTAFMWTGDHRHYLVGPGSDAFDRSLNELVTDVLIPEERDRLGARYFQLSASSDIWDDRLEVIRILPLVKKWDRVLYVFRRPRAELSRAEAPPGFRIERIDRAFLSRTGLVNLDRVIDEITGEWRSTDDFLKKGTGFCVLRGEEIVSWCTMEYVSKGKCGLGVETVEEYSRRGLATLATTACVDHCLARGVTPHWDAWQSNTPSLAVAERVGFEKIEEYAVLWYEEDVT